MTDRRRRIEAKVIAHGPVGQDVQTYIRLVDDFDSTRNTDWEEVVGTTSLDYHVAVNEIARVTLNLKCVEAELVGLFVLGDVDWGPGSGGES